MGGLIAQAPFGVNLTDQIGKRPSPRHHQEAVVLLVREGDQDAHKIPGGFDEAPSKLQYVRWHEDE